ncbi:MAG: ATP-binding protein [bacterium]
MLGPFPVGVPVRGENLIGREKEVNQIVDLVQNHQSIVLIAPRRYGKTSILLEVLDRLNKKGIFNCRVDIFQTSSKKELAQEITNNVLKNKKTPFKDIIKTIRASLADALKHIEIKQVIEDFEFIVSFADPKVDEDSLLKDALDFPQEFAQKYNQHLIIAFDEFGDLKKLNGDTLLKRMRAVFQLQTKVTYIFTGSQESLMEQLFANKHHAFFRFGRILYLGELPHSELSQYIINTFENLGFIIKPEIANSIIKKTNAHPYYSQLLCQFIYFSLKGDKNVVEDKDVEENFLKAIYNERSYFEQLWSDLMERHHLLAVLRSIADEDKQSPYRLKNLSNHNLYRSLSILENKGLIKKVTRGKYEIKDPLFKEYIRLREEGIF